ncbi:MAG: hypothetical protein Q8920_03890, partial [Bacillota bacterium]|nr:hypothetical protein [Bacillota bacterium]
MDENFDRNPENDHFNDNRNDPLDDTDTPHHHTDINNFSMDNRGDIRTDRHGAAVAGRSSATFLVLGWISAALAFVISAYFAIPGIVFGVLANRQARGSGTAVIVTNVVLAAISVIFGM